MLFSSERLKHQAQSLGFNLVGITRAEPSPTLAAYQRWVEAGMHASMNFMARPDRQARREDLNVILPGAQSMVMVGLDYRSFTLPQSTLEAPERGRIASYAWGLDYHDLIAPRLEALSQWITEEAAKQHNYRVYVDTGAILERSHAQQAGMGFVGKNTMLIHPKRGSFFFLAEILTDMRFDHYDTAHKLHMCGNCTRCLNACPTDAFAAPYTLDAGRCISYLTIEHKGWIPQALRPLMGNWVYGCDVCQEVCPFQRFSPPTLEPDFIPAETNRAAPPLLDLLQLDEESFRSRFAGSPIIRIKRDRLVRNACIAAGNWGNPQAIPALIQLLYDPSPLVRGHAAWGLWQVMGDAAYFQLSQLYAREEDPEVRAEIEQLVR